MNISVFFSIFQAIEFRIQMNVNIWLSKDIRLIGMMGNW